MERQVPARLRYTFLVSGVMMMSFALTYIFIPVQWGDLTGCLSNRVPQVFRLFGTAILGLAMASLLAFRETSWESVRIVVQMQLFTSIVFSIVLLLGLLFWGIPAIGWMYLVLMCGIAVAFLLFGTRGRL